MFDPAPAPEVDRGSPGQRSFGRTALADAASRPQAGQGPEISQPGTVEFLLDEKKRFYFIEVNPRIQVEHPVTEMVTGVDIVKEQLLIAMGEPMRNFQDGITPRGAAIEARILAEDSQTGFLPSTGQVLYLKEPGGPGVRIDSALYQGMNVGTEYDPCLAKGDRLG